jgi:DNA-binding CsgD family transcriptional regulator
MVKAAMSSGHDISIEPVSGKIGGEDFSAELTPRQQQILDLMQAGKVNKEIAYKLGIGVGTVKQHIVALFKKLQVSNRAMAVSKGISLQQNQDHRNAALTAAQGIMERRPCVVLSIALPEEANLKAVRTLHGIMAALAFDNDALFLARKGNAGDIIFGVQRVTEYDMVKALQTARAVFNDLGGVDCNMANNLSGGLTAGLSGASMNRHGGWTGEAIASSAIAASRDLVRDALPGYLVLGLPARELMKSFGIGNKQEIADMILFSALDSLRWTGERSTYTLIGRRAELTKLVEALAKSKNAGVANARKNQGRLIYLEGETGMGKSRLCKEISELCLRKTGSVLFFRCLPLSASTDELLNTLEGIPLSFEAAMQQLDQPLAQFPELLIVDDFHLLSQEKQLILDMTAQREAAKGRLVILSGRRRIEGSSGASDIMLQRLPVNSVDTLVREVLGTQVAKLSSTGIHSIAQLAAGVPLFAVEMAKHVGDETLALPLLVVICARLDNLPVDRQLLRCIARSEGRVTLDKLIVQMGEGAEKLKQSLDFALAVGVLAFDAEGGYSFSHPLLQQIIDFLGME